MSDRPHLLGMVPADLAALLRSHGVPTRDAEARRVLGHVVSFGRAGFPERRPVPRRVAEAVSSLTTRTPLEVVERVVSPDDGFTKLLLRSPDGALSEAVLIPLHKPGCYTVCLSSQVGCAMGCAFCATGRLGWSRHLEPWEMVSAFMAARDLAPGRVTGAVFMGQGEPLHNYDRVIKAAAVLSDPCGGRVRAEAISISTVGLAPQIRRFAAEGHRYRLIVSLTSVVPERRARLLPITARYGVEELAAAIREYAAASGGRVTVAWVVLGGVNTGDDEVRELSRLFEGVPLRLNLIDVNDPREGGFRRASPAELSDFRARLSALDVPVVRRYSGGAARHAACGMLAARREAELGSQIPDKF